MITFLPYPSYRRSALCLDTRRLGKQRLEVQWILENPGSNHPAAKMWLGYTDALVAYGLVICDEWIGRSKEDTRYSIILSHKTTLEVPTQETARLPKWFGNLALHSSHRANLLKKDPRWYGAFGWTDNPILPYVWPGVL